MGTLPNGKQSMPSISWKSNQGGATEKTLCCPLGFLAKLTSCIDGPRTAVVHLLQGTELQCVTIQTFSYREPQCPLQPEIAEGSHSFGSFPRLVSDTPPDSGLEIADSGF